jgi:hypothetical protein
MTPEAAFHPAPLGADRLASVRESSAKWLRYFIQDEQRLDRLQGS